jgi:hypothetical protein
MYSSNVKFTLRMTQIANRTSIPQQKLAAICNTQRECLSTERRDDFAVATRKSKERAGFVARGDSPACSGSDQSLSTTDDSTNKLIAET